jgi:hypothetical protein
MGSDPTSTVYRSAAVSLGAQVAFGAFSVVALVVGAARDTELTLLLVVDLVAQCIEFVWYALVVWYHREIRTWTRYLDWVVSTPLMLLGLAWFFAHRSDGGHVGSLPPVIWYVWASNLCMLAAGFAVEVEAPAAVRYKRAVLGGGFGAFIVTFALLGAVVDGDDAVSIALFWVTYTVWAAYGAFAFTDEVTKNVGYNGLDVVSKNVLGAVLAVYALS